MRHPGPVHARRLRTALLCPVLVAGCAARDEPVARASGDCPSDAPVVALSRTGGYDGSAEVVVVDRDGDVDLLTGEWVATSPSFSPDGTEVVVVRADGDYESAGPGSTSLWAVDHDGSEPRALTEGQLDDHPAWSPDGATIAFSRYDRSDGRGAFRLMTVPAEGGPVDEVVPDPGADDTAPAWSPDGRQLAFVRAVREPDGSRATTVWVVDADGPHARPVAAWPDAHSLAWHPDGERILVSAFAYEDGNVGLLEVESGDATQIADHATFAAWAEDGREIVYMARDGASRSSSWRLARGHIESDRLVRDRYVGEIEGDLYPHFGLAPSPCA